MKKDKTIPQELEELSPLLSKMKKEGVSYDFRTPAAFFETLPDIVLKQIEAEKPNLVPLLTKTTWWENLGNHLATWFVPRYAVGFATLAILVMAIFYLTSQELTNSTSPIALEDLSLEEIDGYISQHLDDFQEEILAGEPVVELFQEVNYLNIEGAELEEYLDEILDEVDESALERF